MIIDISKLLNYSIDEISFEENIKIDDSYIKKTDIRKLSPLNIKGSFIREQDDLIIVEMSIDGYMILPCSVSLVDVNYPFNIKIYEVIDLESKENEEYLKIDKNSVDILPLIWQNIVLEIPLKVLSPNLDRSNIKGDGWKLVDED
ncbi:MAG: hypothetical protein GX032_00130 [Tenericutes bacterium]|nr:YceD family protein [Bacilli bacterium]MDD4831812.1 YceD family protein [Bacilli bacterium]NLV89877.1 hypothetical protein [Mycoplasmatota bacterium]